MLRRLAAIGSLLLVLASCSLPEEPEAKPINLKPLIGMKSDAAEEYLEKRGRYIEIDAMDYSPQGQSMVGYGWDDKIIATDGDTLAANDDSLTVWSMRKGEVALYRKMPKMPKIKKGRPCHSVEDKVGGRIFAVWDPRTKHPKGDKLSIYFETLQTQWPYPEAKAERRDFEELEEADYESVVSGQYPKAGKPLRIGQLMAAFCVRRKDSPAEGGSGGVPIPDAPNNEDDDFDFPDKLCPTRFC